MFEGDCMFTFYLSGKSAAHDILKLNQVQVYEWLLVAQHRSPTLSMHLHCIERHCVPSVYSVSTQHWRFAAQLRDSR